MIRLVAAFPDTTEDDVDRIIFVFRANNYEVHRSDARRAWIDYSESVAAGWMALPFEDQRVFDCVRAYLRPIGE